MKTLERWSQAAEEFGISETELKAMSFREGITDEDGKVKKCAIDNGIFILINQGQATITAETKRRRLMHAEFENFKKEGCGKRGCCILIKIVAVTLNEKEAKAAVYTSIAF
jgi:hypothetical protein